MPGDSGALHRLGRLADALRTVLVLELPDRARYGETLRCRMPQGLPTEAAPGRGLTVLGGRVVEFQTALAADAPDDYARADARTLDHHSVGALGVNLACNNLDKLYR